ncbi:uncharacterized protein LOC115263130 [Aedes albopictus]|uniref:Retrotransposon gag domain-containing protein n=1 Tax=Aedes albopictus TaxID=7160 RepID=A0ABM1Y1L9_AEDAL
MPIDMLTLGEFNVAYFNLRADHLEPDEIDFELNSRGVVIPPESGQSSSKKRRRLRAFLVSEQRCSETAVRSFKGDIDAELELCRDKFESMKEDLGYRCPNKKVYRSRLLHLGARLQIVKNYVVGEANEAFADLLSDVVALHNYHFANSLVPPLTPTEENKEDDGEDLLAQIAAGKDVSPKGNQPPIVEASSNQAVGEEIRDVLLDIRAEIKRTQEQINQSETRTASRVDSLEDVVRKLGSGLASIGTIASGLQKTNREVQTLREKISELQDIVNKIIPNVNSPSLPVDTQDIRLQQSPDLPDLPDFEQQALEGLGTPENLQKQTSSKNFGLPNQPFQRRFDYRNPDNSKSFENLGPSHNSQNFHQQPTLPNFALPHQPRSLASVEITGYQRRPQRVADWKIRKYAGNDEGMGLNEFLECVHHYAESEQMSEAELFSSAMHLFTGNALAWFQAMRSQKRFYNWNHLVCELKANIVHPELDAALRMKASQRRQQRNESFQDFYLEMEKIFRAMPAPLSSHEKLDILKRNLRPDYKKVLVFKPVNTLSELMLIGKTIDASKTSIYQKVFGVPKEASTISCKPAYDGYKRSQQQQQSRDNGNGY